MCGFAGINRNDKDLLEKLILPLSHRGPDQSSSFHDELVSLGHRRLSILDLSENGIQPMSNEDGTIWATVNGEIFNFLELKSKLQSSGHVFKSNSDSEVLLHLYEESGPEMLEKLNGQFSFSIYDQKKKMLFLARDRTGILPLYYYCKNDQFIYGSELKAITAAGIPLEIDEEALVLYLRFGYIPSPKSIFRNVYKLKPAHYLIYNLADKKIENYESYWNIQFEPEIKDAAEGKKIIYDALSASVKKRLIADVPVGAFLSGGIDSSAVVSLIRKYKKDLKTFSIKFDVSTHDESGYAREVAEHLKTEHYEIPFTHKDVRDTLLTLIKHYDEPFGDESAVPAYLVSKIAREHVTVSLSGDGGDELLAGYEQYPYISKMLFLNHLPVFVKTILKAGLSILNLIKPKYEYERIREILVPEKLDLLGVYERLYEKISRKDMRKLLKKKVIFSDTTGFVKQREGLSALQQYDIQQYMEGDILAKVDRAAMAVSLETRPPFLDHHFMETCFKLTDSLKIKGRNGKWILKEAFKKYLPENTIKRKKMGFAVPIQYYFEHDLKDLLQKYVFDYSGHDLFDRKFLKSLHGKKDTRRLYWNILMFNIWHDYWIRGNPSID